MNTNYYFARLSRSEREFLEALMMEELEIQTWFAVTYSSFISGEIVLTLQ